MAELEACPFCGSNTKPRKFSSQLNGMTILSISCDGCGSMGPVFATNNPSVEDEENPAIAAWNSRKEPTSSDM